MVGKARSPSIETVTSLKPVIKLTNITKVFTNWQSKRSVLLLFCIFIISYFQSATLALREIGAQIVVENKSQLLGDRIPVRLFVDYLSQLGAIESAAKLGVHLIPLFLLQSLPALVYSSTKSLRLRTIIALSIWLLPAIVGLPILNWTLSYILSPIYVPYFSIELISGNIDREEIAERWFFAIAALGWFPLFWLSITVKNLFR